MPDSQIEYEIPWPGGDDGACPFTNENTPSPAACDSSAANKALIAAWLNVRDIQWSPIRPM